MERQHGASRHGVWRPGSWRVIASLIVAVLALSACSGEPASEQDAAAAPTPAASTAPAAPSGEPTPRIVQPGAPGEPSRVVSASEAAAIGQPAPHTWADVRFMQMMIAHHAQATQMVTLVGERTEREDLPLFARRLEISQEGEIEQMQRWLEQRGETVPDPDDPDDMAAVAAGHSLHNGDEGDHGGDGEEGADAPMPGMLSAADFAALEAASGPEFDELWLELMIRHHEGALTMVTELWTTEDAGQETEIYRLASHINSDQQIELSRMHDMLAEVAP